MLDNPSGANSGPRTKSEQLAFPQARRHNDVGRVRLRARPEKLAKGHPGLPAEVAIPRMSRLGEGRKAMVSRGEHHQTNAPLRGPIVSRVEQGPTDRVAQPLPLVLNDADRLAMLAPRTARGQKTSHVLHEDVSRAQLIRDLQHLPDQESAVVLEPLLQTSRTPGLTGRTSREEVGPPGWPYSPWPEVCGREAIHILVEDASFIQISPAGIGVDRHQRRLTRPQSRSRSRVDVAGDEGPPASALQADIEAASTAEQRDDRRRRGHVLLLLG
jgi:hypothetical protein